MSDIYLSITETPTVVTLTNPLISSNVAQSVTVTNVVSVNVVTMPAITVQAAAPAVTTVAGTVSISNFPSTQTIAGTVTANLANVVTNDIFHFVPAVRVMGTGNDGVILQGIDANSAQANVFEGGAIPVVGRNNDPVAISGTVTANPPTYNLLLNTVTAFTFASSGDSPVFSVSQDVGNTWGFSGAFLGGTNNVYKLQEVLGAGGAGGLDVTLYRASDSNITVTTFSNAGPLLVKSGTLPYDNNPNQGDVRYFKFVKVSGVAGSSITASVFKASISNYGFPQSIAGTVTASIGNSVTIGSLPAISGTVTAAAPNGSLTTRFGTPTTASVAFATSCVTNANRKYLLIQNVTTGSNVITVGIGFTPTTTQGIQLTAGAGITFESSYIPTGAVYVLSSVTASNFTILEA